MQSHSIQFKPLDSRCRYWAKLSRSDQQLPMPEFVASASSLPGHYLSQGEEELMPGDVLFEGEANHHRRTDRGWTYWITYVDLEGNLHRLESGFGQQKAQLKEQGMKPDFLKGAGDIAAMVRIAHGIRQGLRCSSTE